MKVEAHVICPGDDEIPTTIVHADDPLRGPTWALHIDNEYTWRIDMPSPKYLRDLAKVAGELADTVEALSKVEVAS